MAGVEFGPLGAMRVDEPVTEADVREIIREHDRRLAARLREAQVVLSDPDGQWARREPLTAQALADILEADDA